MEFKVNSYITLRLEKGVTVIYIKGRKFIQCKYLLLDIPPEEISFFNEIESIDELSYKLDKSLESGPFSIARQDKKRIPSKVEFWGHCSNLQVWAENDYNTRILHSNLAFPLLRKLTRVGDPIAKKVFKEEIANRFYSGYSHVQAYLLKDSYLDHLTPEERKILFSTAPMSREIKRKVKYYIEDVNIFIFFLHSVPMNPNVMSYIKINTFNKAKYYGKIMIGQILYDFKLIYNDKLKDYDFYIAFDCPWALDPNVDDSQIFYGIIEGTKRINKIEKTFLNRCKDALLNFLEPIPHKEDKYWKSYMLDINFLEENGYPFLGGYCIKSKRFNLSLFDILKQSKFFTRNYCNRKYGENLLKYLSYIEDKEFKFNLDIFIS